MTQIKLRRDTSAAFASSNPILGNGEPAYETDTKKLKIGDGTTAYNSLAYFTTTDEFAAYRSKYGSPSDSVPVVNAGNSITIKAGVSIKTPNGTLTNTTDMTYTYDFLSDRVLFVTENDYYHAYAVYYGGKEPSPVGEQIFWFNNNVWTMISGNGAKTVFNTQKITPIAKIYQVGGTVKNIDYSSYSQISTTGGGSTNISATLPLKIVDGVISLEVDGQTIQIVDGKLHANLDELGNKVNSLTGEVTDLSGRVTAAEADIMNKASKSDLATKQDKLSPIAPLGINQTTISNVTNGTFLTDTSVTLNSAFYINYTTDANARFLITASGVSGGATPTSFIQIPFALGDLISFPVEKDSDSGIGLVFGYWKDDLFYPTMLYQTYDYYGSGSNGFAPFAFVSEAGKSSLERIATYYGLSSAVNKSALVYHESIPLNATSYIQVTKNAGVPTVNMWFTISGASYPNRGYTQRMYTSDTTVLENFNKTNVCLFLSNDTSKAINLTKVTRRELGDTVLNPTVDDLTTALSTYSNSFDATAKVVTNDLSLAIGSGLAITDGKLTASSTAPTNMVTTDTAQTISGQKEFNRAILFLGHNDLIRAQQSGDYRNGAGLSMGSNSTSTDGGPFAPQWKMYSTTGDVDRTETIITTYNQSKLNSSNFNAANKLVRLDSDGKLPAIDGSNLTNLPSGGGSSEPPTNMVTTDTAQTITGDKEFTGITTISNDIKIPNGKKITTPDGQWLMQFGTGFIGIGTSMKPLTTYDNSNYYLHNKSVIAGDGIKITEPSSGEIQISSTIGNMAAYVIEEFVDGTEGYRVWSNGRCEQWGSFSGQKSITFLKNYADTNYMLLAYVTSKTSKEAYNGVFGTAKTTTGFTAGGFAGTTDDAWVISTCGTCNWYSSGILAS